MTTACQGEVVRRVRQPESKQCGDSRRSRSRCLLGGERGLRRRTLRVDPASRSGSRAARMRCRIRPSIPGISDTASVMTPTANAATSASASDARYQTCGLSLSHCRAKRRLAVAGRGEEQDHLRLALVEHSRQARTLDYVLVSREDRRLGCRPTLPPASSLNRSDVGSRQAAAGPGRRRPGPCRFASG